MAQEVTMQVPLVGRDSEWDRITAQLESSDPGALVLAGVAGVGKSRLAHEAARAAAERGYAVVYVLATRASAAIPFGPFAPFLPEGDGLVGDLPGLLRQASDAIVIRAQPDQRLLLVVDDAHLLDRGSAELLLRLVRERSCSALVSVRTPGPIPEPITALWREGLAERIDMHPLAEADVEVLVRLAVGGPVAEASIRHLTEVSGGNALYLRELLIGSAAAGALVNEGGTWVLAQPPSAPERLVELVAGRLKRLQPETLIVLELLAAGEPLGFAILQSLTVPAGIEDAERQGLIEVREDGRRTVVRLTHPIYGEVLRQRLPRSRLRQLWSELGDALEATGALRREDLLQLARWQLDSGQSRDPALFSRAARRARQMFDFDLAARLARAAYDAGGGVPAGLALGKAEIESGNPDAAERVLASLIGFCSDDAERTAVAEARAENLIQSMGDLGAAVAVVSEALARVTDPAPRSLLLRRLGKLRAREQQSDR